MRWYVAYCKIAQETRARDHIQRQGFKCFLPMMATNSGQKPLFPRYLFTEFDPAVQQWRCINGSRGVLWLLEAMDDELGYRMPIPVPRKAMDTILGLYAGEPYDDRKIRRLPAVGSPVRLLENAKAFAGLNGTFLEMAPHDRVKVLLNMLGAKVPVVVPIDNIEKISVTSESLPLRAGVR